MKPTFYFTVSRKELRPSEMPDGMPLLLSAASFLSERKNGNTHLLPPNIQAAQFPNRGADCGGFIATVRWGARYRYHTNQYVSWLDSWRPGWAATLDLCCFDAQPSSKGMTLIYPGPTVVKERQQYTTEMASHFWVRARSVPWAWCPITGYTLSEFQQHARDMTDLIRQMQAYYTDPGWWDDDCDEGHYGAAFRVGVGSLCGRASPTFKHILIHQVKLSTAC